MCGDFVVWLFGFFAGVDWPFVFDDRLSDTTHARHTQFYRNSGQSDEKYPILPWLGYCAFHLGDYKKAMEVYQECLKTTPFSTDARHHLHLGCCYFYLGMYKEAEAEALKGPQCSLQTRLLFHLAHKFNDENKLMMYHQKLHDTLEDQLSLASIHYLRSHFQEATEIYKKKLLEHRCCALVVGCVCFLSLVEY